MAFGMTRDLYLASSCDARLMRNLLSPGKPKIQDIMSKL